MANPTIVEAVIILGGMAVLTAGLFSGRLAEPAYCGLMGTFIGYTVGRIFNRVQHKE